MVDPSHGACAVDPYISSRATDWLLLLMVAVVHATLGVNRGSG